MLRRPKVRHAETRGRSAAGIARLAADAYIFGYPIVLMDAARRDGTTALANECGAAINTFAHVRTVGVAARLRYGAVNADVLHSVACRRAHATGWPGRSRSRPRVPG